MKTAIYARVSTEGQEKQETINSQLADLREYATQNDMDIVEEYIDNGYSGELFDRPALDKLRDDAKNRLFSALLLHSPDRLSRKFIHAGLIQEELKKCGITIIFLNKPNSGDTPEDNLLNNIQGVIAEYEKAKILERTRRGKIHKARSGSIVGSIPPYGYRYINGKYEIDPTESEVVRLIFSLFIDNRMKIRPIVKELIKRDIPSRKGMWRVATVHKILRNETYCGITYYNKYKSFEADNPKRYRRIKNTGKVKRPRSEWIPILLSEDCIIVNRDVFDAAQDLLRRNLTDFNIGNSKHRYLLRGLLRCGNCGSIYWGVKSKGRPYYRCSNREYRFPAPKQCLGGWINASKLERIVWDKLYKLVRQPDLVLLASRSGDLTDTNKEETLQCLDSIESELKNIERETDKILDLYREDIIASDKLKEQMSKINSKRDWLEAERRRLQEEQKQAEINGQMRKSVVEDCRVISEKICDISKDFDAKQHLLHLLIEKIEIFRGQIKIYTVIPDLVDDVVATT
jgi:site-specific DNA recombinase